MKSIPEVSELIAHEISSGRIVGASVMIAKNGKVIYEEYAGLADLELGRLVTQETIFRWASLTKPIVSAATLALAEKGILNLNDPVTQYLPDFTPKLANGLTPIITLHHLLTHTSGLVYGFLSPKNEPYTSAGVSDGLDLVELSLAENLRKLAAVPLKFAPGTRWHYSLSTDVLGAVLEKAYKKPLPIIVEELITAPLEMNDAKFYFKANHSKLATAYANHHQQADNIRKMSESDAVIFFNSEIRYAPSRISNQKAYPSGGAGMAGTAKDYLKFLEAIRNDGIGLNGARILSKDSTFLMTHDVVPRFNVDETDPGYGFGMGFAVLRDSKAANTPKKPGTFEWGGVYGNKVFVDPASQLTVVILTNNALYGLMNFPRPLTEKIYETLQL